MESLHAPWRIEYILAPKPERTDSLFTDIAGSSDDAANYVLVRDRTCYALLNAYPYTGGHLLVVPYKAVPDFNDMTDEEMAGLLRLTRRCQNALTRVMKPDGFNIGINLGKVAGAGIPGHLHIHVVPRWEGDTNFMPVLANTGVLPQALTALAAQLQTPWPNDPRFSHPSIALHAPHPNPCPLKRCISRMRARRCSFTTTTRETSRPSRSSLG
jgi:ATP adenylyltransferase